MQSKKFNLGPILLTTTTTVNYLNPGTSTGGVNSDTSAQHIVLNHITVSNRTASVATVSFWKDATGGNTTGKEFLWTGTQVPANGYVERYGIWRFTTADFLVGGSNTASALVLTAEGEIGIAG